MSTFTSSEPLRGGERAAARFAHEFHAWLRARQPEWADRWQLSADALARYGHRTSLSGRDWLELLPEELLEIAMSGSGRAADPSLAQAERLACEFVRFLRESQRVARKEARFLEQWIQSAASVFKTSAEERAFLSADTVRIDTRAKE